MKTHFYGNVRLVDGMHFRGSNPDGLGVDMDSRPAGEAHVGPAPMEVMLQAAGGCSAMDVAFILRKRRREPEHIEVNLEGIKREEHPRIFKEINVTYRAKGPGITIEELERAAGLSMKTYCSVFGMLSETTNVNWKCELID